MLIEVAKVRDVPPGGLMAVEAGGKGIVLANVDGKIYAIARRCGHMNAPLEKGTLAGNILTCPMHGALFDVTTGKVKSEPPEGGPMPSGLPEPFVHYMERLGSLMAEIKTYDLPTYRVQVEGDAITVEI